MEITFFFSANVLQCTIAFGVVHVRVCFKSFHLLLYFILAGQGSNQFKEIIFVLEVGFYEWKITKFTPNTNSTI